MFTRKISVESALRMTEMRGMKSTASLLPLPTRQSGGMFKSWERKLRENFQPAFTLLKTLQSSIHGMKGRAYCV